MLYNLALLLPCTVSLLGGILLLCKRKNNSRAQNILSLCLFLSSFFFFCTANYIAGITNYSTYWILDATDSFITLLIIPTMYLYFRSLTCESQFTWKDYIWFLPAFIVGIGTFVLYRAMEEADAVNYIRSVLIHGQPDSKYTAPIYKLHYLISVKLYNLTALIQIIGAGTCAVINLKRYHHRLREFYSTLDDKSIDRNNAMLFWFMLTIPLAMGIIIPKRTFWEQYPIFAAMYFIGWAVVYFGIYYSGSQKQYTVEHLARELEQADLVAIRNNYDSLPENDTENNRDETTEMIKTNKYARHLISFRKLIEEDQIFLQSRLRADEMANKMYTNRTYLSRMIKEEFQCTFSDYINRKRIDHSIKLMRSNPEIKQIELAEKSGFLNASTFCRTFKQIMGETPKEWMKKSVFTTSN